MDQDKRCNACGVGTRGPRGACSWCGARAPEAFDGDEHVHQLGLRVNGYAACVGRRVLGCSYGEYDDRWGAGIFSDWPRGSSKPYGV